MTQEHIERKKAKRRLRIEHAKMRRSESRYTHLDRDGMPWRFEDGRPVSMLADEVVEEVFGKERKI